MSPGVARRVYPSSTSVRTVVSTRVVVMRHAQSEANVTEMWTSARMGFPLTERGVAQARAAGQSLRERGVGAVYGSPLVRAEQTAREVAAALGLAHQVLEGVQEIHVGVHEGGLDEEVAPIAIEVFGRWWRDGDMAHRFHEGESGREIADRVAAALERVVAAHPGDTVVVVSHGGAIAVGVTDLCANVDSAFVSDHLLANCATVELVRDAAGWRCESWAGLPLGQGTS